MDFAKLQTYLLRSPSQRLNLVQGVLGGLTDASTSFPDRLGYI